MAKQIEVGTAVRLIENSRDYTFTRFGSVVEIGTGRNEGRTRVKWSHGEGSNGYRREDGKRTWIKTERLTIG
jgi:hypothetical protein